MPQRSHMNSPLDKEPTEFDRTILHLLPSNVPTLAKQLGVRPEKVRKRLNNMFVARRVTRTRIPGGLVTYSRRGDMLKDMEHGQGTQSDSEQPKLGSGAGS